MTPLLSLPQCYEFLASKLPDEIRNGLIMINNNWEDAFVWISSGSVIKPTEWLEIVRRVEEQIPDTVQAWKDYETAILFTTLENKNWGLAHCIIHASVQQRTTALKEVLGK